MFLFCKYSSPLQRETFSAFHRFDCSSSLISTEIQPVKATILNRRHVLTEVDCCKLIKKSSRQKSSNLFELAASDGRFRYDIRAEQLQLQPNGDFCLIRLDSDILYSSMSKPVCYPKADEMTWPSGCWTLSPRSMGLYRTDYAPLQACQSGEIGNGICTEDRDATQTNILLNQSSKIYFI